MGGLSTLFGRSDATPADPPRRVLPAETGEALSLLLTTDGRRPTMEHLEYFTGYAADRGIDLGDIWVVTRGKSLRAAALPVLAAGRTGLLLCGPTAGDVGTATVVADCCDAAVAGLRRDIVLMQMLLDPSERRLADALLEKQFEQLATLIYLQKATRKGAVACPMRGLKLTRYSADAHARFARLIDATYAGSRDCPALHGRREIDDVVAGHKQSGAFDPNFWFALADEKDDLGVLLLAPLPGQEAMEIVYLGLTPAARGRGMGDVLLSLAEHEAGRHGDKYITLAVDAANEPALRLYYRHGYGELQQRVALVRFI